METCAIEASGTEVSKEAAKGACEEALDRSDKNEGVFKEDRVLSEVTSLEVLLETKLEYLGTVTGDLS